jgi:cytidylate kinase
MKFDAEQLYRDEGMIGKNVAGQERSGRLDEQASKLSQLSDVWMNLQQDLRAYTEKGLETSDGRALGTSQPPEAPDPDAWMDEFVVWD